MEQINELVELAQQIDAVIDDAEHGVYGLTINTLGEVEYQVSLPYFLKNFEDFDANRKDSGLYPITLTTEIEGVSFQAMVSIKEIELLDGRLPAEWLAQFRPAPKQTDSVSSIPNSTSESGHRKSPLALPCEDGPTEQIFSSHYA